MKHINLANPYISTLLVDFLSISTKGFSPYKVRVVFFEKSTQKISTLFPLYYEIRQLLDYRQADRPKTRNYGYRLALAIVTAEPPVLPFYDSCYSII
jgi:hypothetical protein